MIALQNRIREAFPRELQAIGARARSRLHDPQAPKLVPRGLEKFERVARGEEAHRVIEIVRQRAPHWRRDSRLDQWAERVYCATFDMCQAGGAAAVIPLGPIDVLGGASTIVGYLSASLGITIATGVSAWASQYGGTQLDASQASGTLQPAYNTNDATIWGRPTVASDGSNDTLDTAYNPGLPSTNPLWMRTVAVRRADAASDTLYCATNAARMIVVRSSTTQVASSNGISGPAVTMTTGVWYRLENLFNNSTTDYLKVGANVGTGTNLGNNDPPGVFRLFAQAAVGTNSGAFSAQRFLMTTVEPSALQKALFDAIDVRSYNGNITL